MHPAAPRPAGGRQIDEALLRHADIRRRAADEWPLVEGQQRPGLRHALGLKRAQQVPEQLAGRIEVAAAVDVGRLRGAAGVGLAIGHRDHRVARVRQADPAHGASGHPLAVEGLQRIHHRRLDGCVGRAAQHPDPVVGQAGGRVDQAQAGAGLHARLDLGRPRRRRPPGGRHAVLERPDAAALGAIIGAGGDDAGAAHPLRIHHLKLHRHVATGRDARHRHATPVGAHPGQGRGRQRDSRQHAHQGRQTYPPPHRPSPSRCHSTPPPAARPRAPKASAPTVKPLARRAGSRA